MRDVAAYMIATVVTFAFLYNGRFALAESLILIGLYVLYICICIYTSRCLPQPYLCLVSTVLQHST